MIDRMLRLFRPKPAAAGRLEPLDLSDPDTIARFSEISATQRKDQSACPLKSGGMLLLDPEDVRAAFSQKNYSNAPSRFSALAAKNKEKYVAAQVAANIPPFLDAPRHTVVRKWLAKGVFSTLATFKDSVGPDAESFAAVQPGGVAQLLVEDVGREFATRTIRRFVGIDSGSIELKRFTAALFKLFAPMPDAETFSRTNAALTDARVALATHLAERRVDRKPCLMTSLLEHAELLDPDDREQAALDTLICDNALLVLADGVENVEAAIGDVLTQWVGLPESERPPIDENFVRSVLNANTPGQTIARIATADMLVAGETCVSGSPVFLSLASANARDTTGLDFSFGLGRHRCIGEALAVETVQKCAAELAKRSPKIDASGLFFEPVFGHRWSRGVLLTLDT